MKGVTCLLLCLIHLRLSRSCIGEGPLLFCQEIPPVFRPGFSSLLMVLKDVGVLNSSVLHSDALSSVTKLRIEGAGITEISAGAFRSFQNLSVLSLIQNQLTDLDPGWFGSPGVLVDLSLTGNRIRVLNESTFEGLANLRTLRLNGNRIRKIHPNTFSSLTNLSELDLSDNNMTQVSPQVFRTLRSTRIHLDGNPWTCSCEAAAFVHFVKDLQSRFLLEKPSDVTCESPQSLRGQNVWNVSVCETETTSKPTTGTRPEPTEEAKTSSPKSPTSGSETSDQNKPVKGTTTTSSHSVTPPPPPPWTDPSFPSGPLKPTPPVTATVTPPIKTDSPVTSVTLSLKPSDATTTGRTPTYEMSGTSPSLSDTDVPYTLVAVIVVLACLLCVACFLAAYKRKRSNKTVTPEKDGKEKSGEMSQDLPENVRNDEFEAEAGWRKSFSGVRAKSANAILFTSPFSTPVMDQATLQSEVTEKQEDEAELDEETATENQTRTTKEAEDERKLDDEISPDAETVPYLSIGTNQNEKSQNESDKQFEDDQTERSVMEKVMSRISTWPLTLMQWQTRCKTTEEEEEEEKGEKAPEVFTIMTPEIFKEDFNKTKQLLDTSEAETVERSGKNPPEESLTSHSQSFKLNQNIVLDESLKEEEQKLQEKPGQSRERKAAEKSSKKSSRGSNKPAGKKVESKQEREVREARAPSAGASPDDETLLSGNEYAFVDLLHEVVQNNGRWTRERWRQRNRNRQRP